MMSPYTGYLLETFVTLAAVCALAFVVLTGARRLGIGRPSGPIALRGHLPLDARRAFYLVQVGTQVFVIAVGEDGFTKLGEVPASALAGQTDEAGLTGPSAGASWRHVRGKPFADIFARALTPRARHGEHANGRHARPPEGAPRAEGGEER